LVGSPQDEGNPDPTTDGNLQALALLLHGVPVVLQEIWQIVIHHPLR
jgi:hypothetical protein